MRHFTKLFLACLLLGFCYLADFNTDQKATATSNEFPQNLEFPGKVYASSYNYNSSSNGNSNSSYNPTYNYNTSTGANMNMNFNSNINSNGNSTSGSVKTKQY